MNRGADDFAMECARIGSAFDLLLKAAIGRLMLHYAVRLAGVWVCGRNRHAAAEALRRERDAALEVLRTTILYEKRVAMTAARTARRNRRRMSILSPVAYRMRAGPRRADFRRRRGHPNSPAPH